MIKISENHSLKDLNTFHIDIKTKYFVELNSRQDVPDFFSGEYKPSLPFYILGGGSNILFTKDFEGYILKPNIKGIQIIDETNTDVYLKVGAGEDWDEFVAYCVEKGYFGIENLSLIPGCVGTCPIQNIGAYGVEVKDVIKKVEYFDIENKEFKEIENQDCSFGYRDSIFKKELKGKFIITQVVFKLSKIENYNLNYRDLEHELTRYEDINLKNVRQAIIDVRNSKLPDHNEIGNGGSFFKNPYIPIKHFNRLKEIYPTMPSYPVNEVEIKIPAGWLIEQCKWKGFRDGDAGVHENQALVLVNYGNAKGEEIVNLSEKIKKSVYNKFAISLETEVNVI